MCLCLYNTLIAFTLRSLLMVVHALMNAQVAFLISSNFQLLVSQKQILVIRSKAKDKYFNLQLLIKLIFFCPKKDYFLKFIKQYSKTLISI